MGSFNRLKVNLNGIDMILQFKFGSTRQHDYEIGSEIIWGYNDVGSRVDGTVVTDAIRENIEEEEDYYITISNNIIVNASENRGVYDFGLTKEGFIVLSS